MAFHGANDNFQWIALSKDERSTALQFPGANLWTGEVLKERDVPLLTAGSVANARDRVTMRVASAVREVEAEDIEARGD
jgi:hypothetical protein